MGPEVDGMRRSLMCSNRKSITLALEIAFGRGPCLSLPLPASPCLPLPPSASPASPTSLCLPYLPSPPPASSASPSFPLSPLPTHLPSLPCLSLPLPVSPFVPLPFFASLAFTPWLTLPGSFPLHPALQAGGCKVPWELLWRLFLLCTSIATLSPWSRKP